MANQALVDYIKQAKAAGMDQSQITAALQQTGWGQNDIDAAFGEVAVPVTASPVAKKTNWKKFFITVVIVIIIIPIVLGLIFFGVVHVFHKYREDVASVATTTATTSEVKSFEDACQSAEVQKNIQSLQAKSVQGVVTCNDDKNGWTLSGENSQYQKYYCFDSLGTSEWTDGPIGSVTRCPEPLSVGTATTSTATTSPTAKPLTRASSSPHGACDTDQYQQILAKWQSAGSLTEIDCNSKGKSWAIGFKVISTGKYYCADSNKVNEAVSGPLGDAIACP